MAARPVSSGIPEMMEQPMQVTTTTSKLEDQRTHFISHEKSPLRPSDEPIKKKQKMSKQNEEETRKKTTRVFRDDWLTKFHWLEYRDGHMFCKLCRLSKKKNEFAKDGAGKTKVDSLSGFGELRTYYLWPTGSIDPVGHKR